MTEYHVTNKDEYTKTGFRLQLYRPSTRHQFTVCDDGHGVRVFAGCRDFNLRGAQAHWGDPNYHRGPKIGNEALWIIHTLVTLANMRGWTSAKFPYVPVIIIKAKKKTTKKKAVKKAARRR